MIQVQPKQIQIAFPSKKKIRDERYFQICDVDKKGRGSYKYFAVRSNASNKEIFETACGYFTSVMYRKQGEYNCKFIEDKPMWRKELNVIEQERKSGYMNVLEKGLKFTIKRNEVIEGVYETDHYVFGALIK